MPEAGAPGGIRTPNPQIEAQSQKTRWKTNSDEPSFIPAVAPWDLAIVGTRYGHK